MRSSSEGTLANIGQVVHRSDHRAAVACASRGATGRIPARSATSTRAKSCGRYRPCAPRYCGPYVLPSCEGAPPPVCVHCCGKCECVQTFRSSDNIERAEEHWVCTRSSSCVSRGRVVVIRKYALAAYARRA